MAICLPYTCTAIRGQHGKAGQPLNRGVNLQQAYPTEQSDLQRQPPALLRTPVLQLTIQLASTGQHDLQTAPTGGCFSQGNAVILDPHCSMAPPC
ncbi:hypothetical protein ULF88_02710 [Halopseudomonas pachastrellae]|nr:hypothetical protein [Halopseudomonas pachastrellae]